MLPRWHIFYGAIFSLALLFVFGIEWQYAGIVFLASVFIDLDHYLSFVINTGKWKLSDSFRYYNKLSEKVDRAKKKGLRIKGDFHLFHTVEFLIFVAVLSTIFYPFFFVLIGMAFHSLLDLYDMGYKKCLYMREFFFYNWIKRNLE